MTTTPCARLLLVAALAAAAPLPAQEAMRLDNNENLMLREIGVIAALEDEDLTVIMILPQAAPPDGYRGETIQRGDVLLMINGERLRDVAGGTARYRSVPVGEEVKLAVARGDQRFLVAFPKADPESLPQQGAMMIRRGPEGTDVASHGGSFRFQMDGEAGDFERVEPVLGLRAVLGERDGTVVVVAPLPLPGGQQPALAAGDVIRRLGEDAVAALDDLIARIEAAAVGDPLALTVERGGEEIAVEVVKADSAGLRVMTREQR